MGNITNNFSLDEFIHSETAELLGIDNTPSNEVIQNIKSLVINDLQPMRDYINEVINVSSGYRCIVLNSCSKIGGVPGSKHTLGQAADIVCEHLKELFEWTRHNIDFHKLILEHKNGRTWIHISYINSYENAHKVYIYENGVYKEITNET